MSATTTKWGIVGIVFATVIILILATFTFTKAATQTRADSPDKAADTVTAQTWADSSERDSLKKTYVAPLIDALTRIAHTPNADPKNVDRANESIGRLSRNVEKADNAKDVFEALETERDNVANIAVNLYGGAGLLPAQYGLKNSKLFDTELEELFTTFTESGGRNMPAQRVPDVATGAADFLDHIQKLPTLSATGDKPTKKEPPKKDKKKTDKKQDSTPDQPVVNGADISLAPTGAYRATCDTGALLHSEYVAPGSTLETSAPGEYTVQVKSDGVVNIYACN